MVKKKERVVEPKRKGIEFDTEVDFGERAPVTRPQREAMRVKQTQGSMRLYAQPAGGLVMIVALLIVPLITIPGMFIPVLLAEVYLLDWTYSKVESVREAGLSFSKESGERSPEDEIDRKIARTAPRDQFVR